MLSWPSTKDFLDSQKQVLTFFSLGGSAPPDPPNKSAWRPPYLVIGEDWTARTTLIFVSLAPNQHFPGNVELDAGGQGWYEIKDSQEIPDLGAIRHTYSHVPSKYDSENGVYIVSDGTFPGNSQMGEGGDMGYGGGVG